MSKPLSGRPPQPPADPPVAEIDLCREKNGDPVHRRTLRGEINELLNTTASPQASTRMSALYEAYSSDKQSALPFFGGE
jgi:hypothetical protein